MDIVFKKMDYYTDRTEFFSDYRKKADYCIAGKISLWSNRYLDANEIEGNIFEHKFEGDSAYSDSTYLFIMDYLCCLLSAYSESGDEIYRQTFEKYFSMFGEYIKKNNYLLSPNVRLMEHPIYAQILLVCKAFSLLGDIPYRDEIAYLFKNTYAPWLMNEENVPLNYNHGIFFAMALLHLSVLFSDDKDAKRWQGRACEVVQKIFNVAYHNDNTNNENSTSYFNYNNRLYSQVTRFCDFYGITEINEIKEKLAKAEQAFAVFIHSDGTIPIIGDGNCRKYENANRTSALFNDSGIAVIKLGDVYLTLKMKTALFGHAHSDISSVTARYKNTDIILDCGSYNENRYSPINRFLRSTAAHSGIFPLLADAMFQKGFCQAVEYSQITDFRVDENSAFVKGKYIINAIEICREISITSSDITVKDSWKCEEPTAIRQRFVIPQTLLKKSTFTASTRTVETQADGVNFKYEIFSDNPEMITVTNFGISSPKYNEYEQTLLLDTLAQNLTAGCITAKISFWEE